MAGRSDAWSAVSAGIHELRDLIVEAAKSECLIRVDYFTAD